MAQCPLTYHWGSLPAEPNHDGVHEPQYATYHNYPSASPAGWVPQSGPVVATGPSQRDNRVLSQVRTLSQSIFPLMVIKCGLVHVGLMHIRKIELQPPIHRPVPRELESPEREEDALRP
jgi:hypothetical protein